LRPKGGAEVSSDQSRGPQWRSCDTKQVYGRAVCRARSYALAHCARGLYVHVHSVIVTSREGLFRFAFDTSGINARVDFLSADMYHTETRIPVLTGEPDEWQFPCRKPQDC
jgi:hypothetical protein